MHAWKLTHTWCWHLVVAISLCSNNNPAYCLLSQVHLASLGLLLVRCQWCSSFPGQKKSPDWSRNIFLSFFSIFNCITMFDPSFPDVVVEAFYILCQQSNVYLSETWTVFPLFFYILNPGVWSRGVLPTFGGCRGSSQSRTRHQNWYSQIHNQPAGPYQRPPGRCRFKKNIYISISLLLTSDKFENPNAVSLNKSLWTNLVRYSDSFVIFNFDSHWRLIKLDLFCLLPLQRWFIWSILARFTDQRAESLMTLERQHLHRYKLTLNGYQMHTVNPKVTQEEQMALMSHVF